MIYDDLLDQPIRLFPGVLRHVREQLSPTAATAPDARHPAQALRANVPFAVPTELRDGAKFECRKQTTVAAGIITIVTTKHGEQQQFWEQQQQCITTTTATR